MNIGILDPQGIHPNPLNNKPYSDTYKQLATIWSKFPIYAKVHTLLDYLTNNQVLLIVAETGSGKTVLMPKIVLHALNYTGKVAITLPKQIITKSSAEFAAKTLDVSIGQQVGYQYKGSPKEAKGPDTKLLYATDGSIVARILKDPFLQDFDAVIVDEAHERKIQIDLLLYLLREVLKKRPTFKLIIMSATINSDLFKRYYQDFSTKQIDISGERRFPIESIFLKEPVRYPEALQRSYDLLLRLIKETPPGQDILVFVTSANEAFDTCRKLHAELETNNIFCVEVFANVDPEQQLLAQSKDLYKQKNSKHDRKVVIATNVAESSLTIEGIKYVIDTGFELKSSYDPDYRARRLDRKLISQAQAKQRMGRAGRTEPGVCYHLYTKSDFDDLMEKFPPPDIRTSDISNECLKLLTFNSISTVPKLVEVLNNFIEPPTNNYISTAIATLTQLGFVANNTITDLGKIAVDLNIELIGALSVIIGRIYSRENSIMKIYALLEACNNNMSDLFLQPKMRKDKDLYRQQMATYTNTLKKFKHKNGDHQSLLNVYNKFIDQKSPLQWCKDNFLRFKTLKRAQINYRKLREQLDKVKDAIDKLPIQKDQHVINTDDDQKILYCINYSHTTNTATNNRTLYSRDLKIRLSQQSFLNLNKKIPKTLIYEELFILLEKPTLNIASKHLT